LGALSNLIKSELDRYTVSENISINTINEKTLDF
jgi:hypothetical protein